MAFTGVLIKALSMLLYHPTYTWFLNPTLQKPSNLQTWNMLSLANQPTPPNEPPRPEIRPY